MRVNWERGTIDFKAKSLPKKRLKTQDLDLNLRVLIGTGLSILGVIAGWIGWFPIIHEVGHAVAAALFGQGTIIHWDHVNYAGHAGVVKRFVIDMGGPFGGLALWMLMAMLMIKRLPEYSTFFMGYGIGESLYVSSYDPIAQTDFFHTPNAQLVLRICVAICSVIYFYRLTGGFWKWFFTKSISKE